MAARPWFLTRLNKIVESVPWNAYTDDEALKSRSPKGKAAYEFCKRALDIGGSLLLIVSALPVMVVLGTTIIVSSGRPVLFVQERVGKNGVLFRLYKFRTMVARAEQHLEHNQHLAAEYRDNFKIRNDPRVTQFGEFLRRTSLDELPQLFNVLKGEMSLIGPRPLLGPELAAYGMLKQRVLSVKPGMTGLWQVLGRSNTTWPEHVRLDILYVEHRSAVLDFYILCATVPAVIGGRGAY